MAKYSTEFKMRVVREYLESKISYNELAKKFNIRDKKTIRAVSYTHLDVYKRQIHSWPIGRSIPWSMFGLHPIPVSYTHLTQ